MAKAAKFNDPVVLDTIRASNKTLKELATQYYTSVVTIWKIRNYKGAYAQTPSFELGRPILNINGVQVGVETHPTPNN